MTLKQSRNIATSLELSSLVSNLNIKLTRWRFSVFFYSQLLIQPTLFCSVRRLSV